MDLLKKKTIITCTYYHIDYKIILVFIIDSTTYKMHIWENVNATVLYNFHILGYVDNATIHIKILIHIKHIIRTEQKLKFLKKKVWKYKLWIHAASKNRERERETAE